MMGRLVNLEILGHPINWIILVLLIVLIWFGIFAVAQSPFLASVLPSDSDGGK
jgi:hypothetical protein